MNTHFKLVFSLQMCVLGFVWAGVRWRHTSLPFWPPGSADVHVHLVQPRSHVLPRWRHAGERHLLHCTFLCTRYYFYLLLSHLLCYSRKPSLSSLIIQRVFFKASSKSHTRVGVWGVFTSTKSGVCLCSANFMAMLYTMLTVSRLLRPLLLTSLYCDYDNRYIITPALDSGM